MRTRLAVVLLLVLFPGTAGARMATATMRVSAYVINDCVANVPSSIALPSYDGTEVRSSASMQLKCTKGASPVIAINNESGSSGAPLNLTGPNGSQLTYGVFSDAALTDPWEAITGQSADGLTFQSYTLYLSIPPGQAASPGTYAGQIDLSVDPGTRAAKHYIIPVACVAP
jgi:spore coat protein U domain-containing protein, fimbrial subunit CupE1/2/3/6